MINCINTQGEDERKLMWQATGPPKGKYTLMNIGGHEIALDLFFKTECSEYAMLSAESRENHAET